MATIKGIDVSKHNGSINWSKVKDAGIKFVISAPWFISSLTIDDEIAEFSALK